MTSITKSIFLNAIACPTYGWLLLRGELRRPPTLSEKFRLQQGLDIGEQARQLNPTGILVDVPGNQEAAQRTEQLLVLWRLRSRSREHGAMPRLRPGREVLSL